MKKLFLLPLFASVLLLFSCGGDAPKPEKKTEPVVEEVEAEVEEEEEEDDYYDEEEEDAVATLSNKGVGPIKDLVFPEEIDEELAAKGKSLYADKGCIACHNAKVKVIGPAPKGIFEKRHPAWVMNMIMDPEGMVVNDPDAKALLEEYNNVPMTNQDVSEEEARAMLEYFRTL